MHRVTANLAVMPTGCESARKGTSALAPGNQRGETLGSPSWEQGKNKGLIKCSFSGKLLYSPT